ncbi:MAG: cystathionine beta-synthase [Candidatus Hodarchaeales archaeon]|jgi:cystathionine beta-synthase
MSAINDTILDTIGHTPVVRLRQTFAPGVNAQILLKLEKFNPGGSVKDRIGLAMIEDAERKGLLQSGGTIVEGTSGNTGVGLAMAAAVKGYNLIFTIPDKMAQEKINLLRAFGAKVIVCPTAVPPDHPSSYYSVAKKLAERPNHYYPNQYFNQANPTAHYMTTGPEIWEQLDGQLDILVAGMGTGGTISGVAKFLKEKNPAIRIIGVDPVGSVLKDFHETGMIGEARSYKVEGIGEDIIPETLHLEFIDEIIKVDDETSFQISRRLAREEGIFCGGSSGTALAAALELAKAENLDAKTRILVLLPDTGERYLTKFFSDRWMRENAFHLETQTVRSCLYAKDPQIPDLISVKPEDLVCSAIMLMKKYGFSQLPVIDDSRKVVGTVYEDTIMREVIINPSSWSISVKDHLTVPLPIVPAETELEDVLSILVDTPAVIVEEANIPIGILTRVDVMDHFYAHTPIISLIGAD